MEDFEVKKMSDTEKGFVADISIDGNSICRVLVEDNDLKLRESYIVSEKLCKKIISDPEVKDKILKLKKGD